MMKIGFLVRTAVVALFLCSSCGSGDPFVPSIGPFTGNILVEDAVIGDLSLTTTGGLLGGTGTIIHNAQAVNVVISATIRDQQVSGTISNASLGSGNFIGEFTEENKLNGQFNYQDIGQISITAGTWSATMPLEED